MNLEIPTLLIYLKFEMNSLLASSDEIFEFVKLRRHRVFEMGDFPCID